MDPLMIRLRHTGFAFVLTLGTAAPAYATESLSPVMAIQSPPPQSSPQGPLQAAPGSAFSVSDSGSDGGRLGESHLELDPTRRWSVLVEGFGGLGVLKTSEGTEAHSLAGGMARFRIWYIQAGGYVELTDRDTYDTRALGGVLGAYFPFRSRYLGAKGLLGKWVDLDAVIGMGVRTYTSRDVRYGAGGFEESTPVGSLRLGVSDRSGSGTLGARLGAHLLASVDFAPKTRSWEVNYESEDGGGESFRGTTPVGGYSFGMALSLGLDIGRTY
jgi:hypothetical protein